jgi:hypothetical protein
MSMGDDFNDSPESGAIPAHPAEQHATYRAACAELMRQRDSVISSAAVRAMQDAARMFDATQGRQHEAHIPLTDAQVGAACLAYRHDYGRLLPHAQERIALECRQWDDALRKARQHDNHFGDGNGMAGTHRHAATCNPMGCAVGAVGHMPADDTEGGEA